MLVLSSGKRLSLDLLNGHHLRYSVGAAAVMATLITFAFSRDPPASPSLKFQERWNTVPIRAVPLPVKPVRTISITTPQPASPALPEIEGLLLVPMPKSKERPPIDPPENPLRQVSSERKASPQAKGPDICRGKGRIYTRGGRSWRCRR